MAGRFGIAPDVVRRVVGDVDEIGAELAEIVASLRAEIGGEAVGAACALTPGDAISFWTPCSDLERQGESLAEVISELGDFLGRAVSIFEQSDRG
jgi:hypothetical protein